MFPDKRVLLSRFHRWGHSHDAHARHADWNLVLRFTRKPRESLRSPTWNVDNVWQSSRNSCNSIVNHCVRWTPRGTNRVSCRGRWMQIDPFSHCVIGELDIMCVVNCPVYTQQLVAACTGITVNVYWIILFDDAGIAGGVVWMWRGLRNSCYTIRLFHVCYHLYPSTLWLPYDESNWYFLKIRFV